MGNNQYIVALEIGSTKIVGAIAEKTSSGYVSVNCLEEEKLTACVRYGCVKNVESTKSCINRILKKLENRIDGSIKEIYVGLSGRSLHSVESEVNRNLDSSQRITDETLQRITRDAAKETIPDYEVIEIVPRSYIVDKVETTKPSGQYGSSINIKLNKIVAKPAVKLNLERATASIGINTKVKNYLITPLVVADEILTEEERSTGCILVDMGAETTTVSIYKKTLVYLTTLPMGGRNVTNDIALGLNVLDETAERVKKGISSPFDTRNEAVTIENVNSAEAVNYITSRTEEIISNVIQQIDNAQLLPSSISTVVLIGGGAQMSGIKQKFEDMLKIRVRMGSYPQSLNITDHNINRPEYIQIFSLLAKGAEIIPDGSTCVERRIYSDGPSFTNYTEPEPKVIQPKPEPQKPVEDEKPKRPNRVTDILKKARERLGEFLKENDGDDK